MQTSVDAVFEGRLLVEQPLRGYRFGIDAILLGAGAPDGARILDAGSAVGLVAMLAATHQVSASVTALEVQPELAALARENVFRNGLEGRVEVIEGDLLAWSGGGYDLVLMNPPFFPSGTGRSNPDEQRNAARHEVFGTLPALCRACAKAMGSRGCLRVVFPAEQLLRLTAALQGAGLKVARVRAVHSFASSPAKLVLVDARNHGRRELTVAPPLTLYDKPGDYTEGMRAVLAGQRVVL